MKQIIIVITALFALTSCGKVNKASGPIKWFEYPRVKPTGDVVKDMMNFRYSSLDREESELVITLARDKCLDGYLIIDSMMSIHPVLFNPDSTTAEASFINNLGVTIRN